jgi:hypothetical protein
MKPAVGCLDHSSLSSSNHQASRPRRAYFELDPVGLVQVAAALAEVLQRATGWFASFGLVIITRRQSVWSRGTSRYEPTTAWSRNRIFWNIPWLVEQLKKSDIVRSVQFLQASLTASLFFFALIIDGWVKSPKARGLKYGGFVVKSMEINCFAR